MCVIPRTLQMATMMRSEPAQVWRLSTKRRINKISDFVARITTRVAHAEKTLSTLPSDYSKKLTNTEHNRTLPTTARITQPLAYNCHGCEIWLMVWLCRQYMGYVHQHQSI